MSDAACVWYAPADYASLPRRLAACLIDAVAVLAIIFLPLLTFAAITGTPIRTQPTTAPSAQKTQSALIGLALLVVVVGAPYHLYLRRTRGGTLGYRLAGVRLVMFDGSRPTFRSLAIRLVIASLMPALLALLLVPAIVAAPKTKGPLPRPTVGSAIGGAVFLVIIFGLASVSYWSVVRNARRQAQHDRFAGTWLIRRTAQPAGAARPLQTALFIGSWALPYWDVEPIDDANARPA
ncbi:MAG: RDD family protein [Phycisphaerae bacterium]